MKVSVILFVPAKGWNVSVARQVAHLRSIVAMAGAVLWDFMS